MLQILSREAENQADAVQQCVCICESYLGSGDGDHDIKNMLETLAGLSVKIKILNGLINEKLQAIQVALKISNFYGAKDRM